jgi:ABC-type multidrug transport system fused ATPase/permease subunit
MTTRRVGRRTTRTTRTSSRPRATASRQPSRSRRARRRRRCGAGEQSRAAIAYALSAPGGWVSACSSLAFYAVHGVRIAGDFWLSFWSGNALGLSVPVYAGGYAAFAVGFVIGVYLRNVFLGSVTLRKSHALHNGVLDKLTRAPLAFFEQVPFGTTLALLTKHMSVVDRNLPDTLAEALQYSPLAIGSAFVGMAVVPWSFITLIVLLPAMALLMWKYMPAQNIAMGVEVQSRTRVFEVIASHAQGAVTIVAFGAQERVEGVMFGAFNKLLDNAAAHKSLGTRIAVWMDVLVTLLIGAVALLVVHLPLAQTPSRAGLAIANVLQLLVFTQWSVKAVFGSRNNVESAGVMAKAIEVIASEAPPPKSPPQLPEPWPERGEIEFDRVAIRYGGPGGRVALRDITLRIKPQEHIGVVGRTGSGKSSLVASLFRIVELFGNGSIKIDGIKTTELPLAYLRSHIAIVPQESVVLADTVRRNLDPVGRFEGDNETLWRALRRVKLAQLVERAPGGLDALIDETGNDDDDNDAKRTAAGGHRAPLGRPAPAAVHCARVADVGENRHARRGDGGDRSRVGRDGAARDGARVQGPHRVHDRAPPRHRDHLGPHSRARRRPRGRV